MIVPPMIEEMHSGRPDDSADGHLSAAALAASTGGVGKARSELGGSDRTSPSGAETTTRSPERGHLTASETLALLDRSVVEMRELEALAEAMAQRRSRDCVPRRLLIGLISGLLPINDLTHPVFEPMLIGIRGRLSANDCDLLLCATRSIGADADLRRSAAEQTIERGPNALIAWAIAETDPEFEPIMSCGLPTIFVDNHVLGTCAGSVTSANYQGMAELISHLHATGRRRIAHISGHFVTRPGLDRMFAYRSELDRLGLISPPEYMQEGVFFQASGFEGAKRLLSLADPPDAIACASDAMAVGAMAAIEQAGLRVPEDIAVTGYDDAEFATMVRPALTTIRQDALAMGTAAAEAALRMLENPDTPPPVVVIPGELVVRESSLRQKES